MTDGNSDVPEHLRCRDSFNWPVERYYPCEFLLDGGRLTTDRGQGFMYQVHTRYKPSLGWIRLTRQDPLFSLGVEFSADEAFDEWSDCESGNYVSSLSAFIERVNSDIVHAKNIGLRHEIDLSGVDESKVIWFLPTYMLPMVDSPVFLEKHVVELLNHIVDDPVVGSFFSASGSNLTLGARV